MVLDAKRIRTLLEQFDLQKLFIEELGWDHHTLAFDIPVDGRVYHLSAIAHKRGFIAFLCKPATPDGLPDHAARRKIERLAAKTHAEHLIVFVDPDQTTQIWQWVKREPGRPAISRENTWRRWQSGESLIQKLGRLVFTLDEEEQATILDSASRVRSAFDVERVTKRFYERFQAEHDAFARFIKGIPDSEMLGWYVSVMLNRLMFIYFIQKKGFLDGNDAYLRTKLAAGKHLGKDRFYKDFLCPLFFQGFAVKETERPGPIKKLLGNIPYLNGGLFLRHQIEEHCGENIQIADAAFDKIFDFFDAYQWHLDERAARNGDEINPDVLGYIFEKYINQKQMGAYYTKEDITEYISKNTLIPFLFDAAKKQCPIAFKPAGFLWKLLSEDPDRYLYPAVRQGVIDADGHVLPLPPEIDAGLADVSQRGGWNKPAAPAFALPTETWREHVARRQRCLHIRSQLRNGQIHDVNDLITLNLDIRQFAQDVIAHSEGPELVRAFYQALEKLTVLDPTCGSGAFLFAALNVLQPLYEACLDRMAGFLTETAPHRPEKFTDFRKVLDSIKLHPNHDYFILKSIIVNNLYGVDLMEEAVEICKLRLFLKLVAQLESADQIEPLPDIDFNIRAGNTLVGYATQADAENNLNFGNAIPKIAQKAAVFDLLFQQFRRHQLEDGPTASTRDVRQLKQDLLKPLTELRQELDQFLAVTYGQAGKGKFDAWRKSHQPFHWFAEFYGIMQAGGFDVIIGNPPYVELKEIKSYGIVEYKCEDAGNLYAVVIERCFKLTSERGRMGFIVPVSSISTDRYAPLQKLLRMRRLHYSSFDDRPSRLFDGLEHIRLTIHLIGEPLKSPAIYSTRYNKWSAAERSVLFQNLLYATARTTLVDGTLPKFSADVEQSIAAKLANQGKSVGEFYAKAGKNIVYYSRKVGYFLQVLNFQPNVLDGRGNRRPPSEFKELAFSDGGIADAVLCSLNSNLCYWFITIFSDCRHVNKREVDAFPADAAAMTAGQKKQTFAALAKALMDDLSANSEERKMKFKHDHLTVQSIIPKRSKSIIDDIDRVLAKHYGFTDEETDFLINYDIKYRMGGEEGQEEAE